MCSDRMIRDMQHFDTSCQLIAMYRDATASTIKCLCPVFRGKASKGSTTCSFDWMRCREAHEVLSCLPGES